MRKSIMRFISKVLTFCLTVTLLASMGSITAKADSVSWNFKNSEFKNLGTISSTVTVDGLSLIATSSKTMSVKSNSVTVDGTTYSYCLALGGTGNTSYRAVKVPVSGSDTIKVVLKSSGSSTRSLVVADASGNKLGTLSAGSSASIQSYNYSGSSGYVYLYSSGSGINIYKIQVDSKSSSSSSSSSSNSSSSTTVSNYSTLSDGWYYIKNVNSQKYLQVTNNSGYDGANVEQGSGSGVSGQKWYLTNTGSGYFTLKNGTGYMLDVPYGENADGTNIQVWSNNNLDPQKFKLVASSKSGAYGILTKASADTKSLDVYNFSTADGGNVCQWTYYDNTCQQWIFEAVGGSSSSSGSSSSGSSSSGSSSSAASGDLFVSTSGKSSNSGTQSSPYDLATAIKKIGAGKTIWVMSGTYKLSSTIVIDESNSGKSGSYKKVSSYNGGTVTLDFSSMSESGSNRGIVLDGDYWHFYDIDIKGAGDNGMLLSGNNNKIEMCQFYENHDSGLQISRYQTKYTSLSQWPAYNQIINCTSFNNKDEATAENADGFAAKLTCGNGNVFDGCIAYCNSDDGWDLYAKPETGSIGVVTLKNCVAFGNGKLTDGSGSANGDMNGFKLGGSNGQCPTAHVVSNCLAFNNGACGFTDNGNGGAISMTGCTAVNNGVYASKANYMCYRTSSSATYKNLLSYSDSVKSADKFLGKMNNTVYANSGFYYISSGSFSGSAVKQGTKLSLSSSIFSSTSIPGYSSGKYATNYHEKFRASDGSIDMNGLFQVKSGSAVSGYGVGASLD